MTGKLIDGLRRWFNKLFPEPDPYTLCRNCRHCRNDHRPGCKVKIWRARGKTSVGTPCTCAAFREH